MEKLNLVSLNFKMPIKLKKIFEAEYGIKNGDRIFYAWENKNKKLKFKKLKNRR